MENDVNHNGVAAVSDTDEDMVSVPISKIVMLVAVAAVADPNWPERAAGVRKYLAGRTLDAIREVAARLDDYANSEAGVDKKEVDRGK